jgi:hypothetical protein
MASTPLHSRHETGLRPRLAKPPAIRNEGQTCHYGGASPWPARVDRSSAARFIETANHDSCPAILRAWQAFHIDGRGWTDIAYNSAVCPHGHRYDLRGVGVRSGANGTNEGNARSCATVYIAGDNDPLTDLARVAFLDEGERFGHGLVWNHSDWKPTSCAGSPIKAWQRAGWPRPNMPIGEDILPALNDSEQRELLDFVRAMRPWTMGLQAQINDMDQDTEDLHNEALSPDRLAGYRDMWNNGPRLEALEAKFDALLAHFGIELPGDPPA